MIKRLSSYKIISHLEMNKVEKESFPQFAVEDVGNGIKEKVWLSMTIDK